MNLLVPDHIARQARRTLQQGKPRGDEPLRAEPARVRTQRGEFLVEPWNGSNESGREAIGDNVIVLPDVAAPTSAGGIIITDAEVTKQAFAAESGFLVAIGPDAFIWNADRTRRWEGEKPQVGDHVHFTRYQYVENIGEDGRRYWFMTDKSIVARDKRVDSPKVSGET